VLRVHRIDIRELCGCRRPRGPEAQEWSAPCSEGGVDRLEIAPEIRQKWRYAPGLFSQCALPLSEKEITDNLIRINGKSSFLLIHDG
jgi:hypothetical protein